MWRKTSSLYTSPGYEKIMTILNRSGYKRIEPPKLTLNTSKLEL